MKTKTLLFVLLMMLSISYQATSQVTFQKTYGGSNNEEGYMVRQTTDGGYIILGNTYSFGHTSGDIYLIKTDAWGNTQWKKTYGGSVTEYGNSIQQTTDGGYIVAGFTNSYGNGNGEVYLIKTAANGDTLWTRTYGQPRGEGISVQQTSDGGYIVAGNNAGWPLDFYVVKTTATGDTLWTKTYGGTDSEFCNSVQQTTDGGYIISGVSNSFGGGNFQMYMVRTDASGDTLWSKAYVTATSNNYAHAQQTSDGGFIIACPTTVGPGNQDFLVVKTNASGDTVWTKTYGSTGNDYLSSIRQTADGGFILAGSTVAVGDTTGNIYLVKTTSTGDTLWTKNYGGTGDDWTYYGEQTTDGGYIVSGATFGDNTDSIDILIIKTDANGNSGCNQGHTPTTIGHVSMQIVSCATIVTSAATFVSGTTSIIGSGGSETDICTTLGINETTTVNVFALYPNPATSNFTLELSSGFTTAKVQIFNTLGAMVYEQAINQSSTLINMNVPAGIYFVKVSGQEKTLSQKLIIQ